MVFNDMRKWRKINIILSVFCIIASLTLEFVKYYMRITYDLPARVAPLSILVISVSCLNLIYCCYRIKKEKHSSSSVETEE